MLKFYAFIEDNKVQNIVPCHGKEDAIENARLQYDNPSVVEIGTSKCDLMIGDKYENGFFYHFNHDTKEWDRVDFVQETSSNEVRKLRKEILEVKNMLKPSIDANDCLFEDFQNFRIGEAVYRFNLFLNNYYISFNKNGNEHLISASKENWNDFITNFTAYKILIEYDAKDKDFTWYDAEGTIFSMTIDEAVSIIKDWKNSLDILTVHMNNIVTSIRNCTKKAEVAAIVIDYNIL